MDAFMEKMLQHGFSIAVASYLLIRTDKRIGDLKDALDGLKNAVDRLVGVIEAKREIR
jgi:hypothetical protein